MSVQWQKVHVFISSTFNDMHAERDYLVKRVFPELQDWCERRKLRLVDVDLRWGVTEADATANANVVRTCLKRIDDCRPFFVCLLGQRYGWAPAKNDVSAETLSAYPYLQAALDAGASVTEMEILHAIVRPFRDAPTDKADDSHYQLAEHSFFYLRDSGYLDDLPDDPPALRRIYTDEAVEDDANRADLIARLRLLREDTIPGIGRPVRRYRATWKPDARTPEIGVQIACPALLDANVERWRREWEKVLGPGVTVTGRELPAEHAAAAEAYNGRLTRGRLMHFTRSDGDGAGEDLATTILRDLKAAIAARHPDHVEVEHATGLQRELDQQEQFLYLSSDGYIECGNDLGELDDYVLGDSERLLVLTAEGGMGKSMLLANWIDRCRRQADRFPNTTFHARFVGQSDGSSSVAGLLRLLLEEMQDVAGKLPRTTIEKQMDPEGREREVEVPFEIPADPRKIPQFWKEQLPRLGERVQTVIVIDALNQLEGGLRDVSWLPLQGLPPGVKLIVSFRSGAEDAAALIERLERNPHVQFDDVAPFENVADRKRLVARYLEQYLKELDDQHVEQLVRAAGAANPLYLKVVLSELRVFGSFTGLREKIEHDFGPTPMTAFGALLRRLEGDPSYTAVDPKKAVPVLFGLLLHARRGLSGGELTELFVDQLKLQGQRREDVAEAVQVLLRQAVAFLGRRDGLFDYFFESFELAARARYVAGGEDEVDSARGATDWHGDLAHYFAEQPLYVAVDGEKTGNRRKLDEVAYQQANARVWPELRGTLTSFDFLHAKLKWLGYEPLAEDFQIAAASGYADRDLALVQSALALGANVLRADDRQLPSQLVGRLMVADEPSVGALVAEAKERPDWPWLRPLRPSLIQAGGSLVHTLEGHLGVIRSIAVSLDGRRVVSGSSDNTVGVWDLDSGALLHRLTGHTRGVRSVAVSLDSRRVVSGSDDRTVRVWDVESGALLLTLAGHTGGVGSVVVCPKGQRVVSGSDDGTVRVWDLETGAPEHLLMGHTDAVLSVAISRDGRRAVSGSLDKTVRAWDLESGLLLHSMEGHSGAVWSLAVSPDSCRAISGSRDGTVRVWNLESGELLHLLEGHSDWVRSVVVSPDGHRAVSVSDDATLRVWDVESGLLLHTLAGHSFVVTSVAVSPDGRRAVSGSMDKTVRVWDLHSGSLLLSLEGHVDSVECVTFSSDGRRAVSGSSDKTVRVWDLESGTSTEALERDSRPVTRVAVSQDGRFAVSRSDNYTVRVWDLEIGSLLHSLVGHMDSVTCVVLSPDGRRVVSGSLDNTVRIWDLQSGVLLHVLKGHSHWVQCIAVSADGRRVVSGSQDNTVRVWDLDSGALLCSMDGHLSSVVCVAVSPDGRRAVSAATDKTVRVWDLESRAPVYTQEGYSDWVRSVAVSPDGRRAVSQAPDKAVRVWDLDSGTLLHSLVGHRDSVTCVTLSPDGRRAVSGSRDKSVRVWDLESGTLLLVLEGHSDCVSSVAVTPDGRRVVSGSGDSGPFPPSEDKTVRIWDLESGTELARFTANHDQLVLDVAQSRVATGGKDGVVHLLAVTGLDFGPWIVTARRAPGPSEWSLQDDVGAIEVRCPMCGTMSTLSADQLGQEIACAGCGEHLRLNPFVVHEFTTTPAGLAYRVTGLARRLLGRR